jgi:hypothetical protein
MNAYDLIQRPIQTVINSVESGNSDKKGIMKDFISGMANATKEIASPFIETSLWVGALLDVLPTGILGRGGLDAEGRRIWNPNDKPGNKIMAQVGHLTEALAPLNANQLNRLFRSALPDDSTLSIDKYGRQYDLGKELAGMVGLRAVDVNPESGIKYKINQFQKDVRNSRSLFTGKVLKGGPISPEEVVDAYINANRALYNTNRNLYKDVKAAETLGVSTNSIESIMDERGVGRTYEAFENGEFRPYSVSKAVKELFEFNASQINQPDAMQEAEDVIDRIEEVLGSASISSDSFPDIENPFRKSLLPEINLGSTPAGQLPPVVTGAAATPGFVGQQNVNIPFTQLPEDQKLERIDQVDKLI